MIHTIYIYGRHFDLYCMDCVFIRGKSDEEKAKNGIKDNLVRFSFGIEKFEDLRDDILQALEKI
ncbi:unnamed protein product [Triticum turgidum subsp. durum]|uniref:Uncharacterized protein n=1 Tax=Triticum turgidum subsp. durum TaxID=4567 RepID=A0A9R1PCR0_TRITD|nr:unnamed protein product [Triticum turgidum subsp. durum]VAH41028.1 unnamed protein product [Triticum turgidum subsp. durum]VAH41029.1 unnamed protein product [Triticum turgidum subsp. durum]